MPPSHETASSDFRVFCRKSVKLLDEKIKILKQTRKRKREVAAQEESARKAAALAPKMPDEVEAMRAILHELKHNPNAQVFLEPVDPVKFGIPDYPKVIKNPMDLGTAESKIPLYESTKPFVDDLRLIWDNALRFNNTPTDPVHQSTLKMQTACENLVKKYYPDHSLPEPSVDQSKTPEDEDVIVTDVPQQPQAHDSTDPAPAVSSIARTATDEDVSMPTVPATGAGADETNLDTVELTYEEKEALNDGFSQLDESRISGALDIIQANCSNIPEDMDDDEDDEVEVDIDQLSTAAQRKLQKYIREALKQQQVEENLVSGVSG